MKIWLRRSKPLTSLRIAYKFLEVVMECLSTRQKSYSDVHLKDLVLDIRLYAEWISSLLIRKAIERNEIAWHYPLGEHEIEWVEKLQKGILSRASFWVRRWSTSLVLQGARRFAMIWIWRRLPAEAISALYTKLCLFEDCGQLKSKRFRTFSFCVRRLVPQI